MPVRVDSKDTDAGGIIYHANDLLSHGAGREPNVCVPQGLISTTGNTSIDVCLMCYSEINQRGDDP